MSALLPNWLNEVVAIRLHSYFSSNDLLPSCQSAYRKHYSTETAMLRVWSNILMAADQRQVTLLALLDMSAAFDCVLLRRLQIYFGLSNAPLEWIRSFLSDRTYQLAYGGDLSHTLICCSMVCHKDQSWVHCCMFSTQQRCVTWWSVTVCTYTSVRR